MNDKNPHSFLTHDKTNITITKNVFRAVFGSDFQGKMCKKTGYDAPPVKDKRLKNEENRGGRGTNEKGRNGKKFNEES